MKFNLSLFLLSIGAALSSAFVHHGSLAGSSQRMVSLFAVNEDEIAALRAQAAKAREQANALAKVSHHIMSRTDIDWFFSPYIFLFFSWLIDLVQWTEFFFFFQQELGKDISEPKKVAVIERWCISECRLSELLWCGNTSIGCSWHQWLQPIVLEQHSFFACLSIYEEALKLIICALLCWCPSTSQFFVGSEEFFICNYYTTHEPFPCQLNNLHHLVGM